MLRKLIAILLVMLSLMLVSCGSSDADRAEGVGQIIIDALGKRDEDLLKSVLSVNALESADLQDGINYCFDILSEPITSVTKYGFPERDHFDSGEHTEVFSCGYSLFTESGQEYFLDFEYCTVCTSDSDSIGVNQLKLTLRNEGQEGDYKSVNEYGNFGVYNPLWDE